MEYQSIDQQQQRIRSTYINMHRKMVRCGFERRIDDNKEQTFHFVMSREDVLRVCKTEDILQYVKRQQNYLGHITKTKEYQHRQKTPLQRQNQQEERLTNQNT